MAFAWRLADPRFAEDLLGTGNRIHGARWNSPGRGVLYCSENLSLCVLETFVHLNPLMRDRLPPRTAVRIDFPDDAKVMEIAKLPDTARAERCRAIGNIWLDEGDALILKAPSVVVPLERNLMFNPSNKAMAKVRIVELIAFKFDERMMQR
jgi:RES domain-containing protein